MGTIWTPDLEAFTGPKYQRLVSAIEQGILRKVLPMAQNSHHSGV